MVTAPEIDRSWDQLTSRALLQRVEEMKTVLIARSEESIRPDLEVVFGLPGRGVTVWKEKCVHLGKATTRISIPQKDLVYNVMFWC